MNVHRIIEEALEGNDDITLPNQADQEFCSDDGVMKLASALNFIGNNLENAVPSQEEILAQAELLSSLEKEAGMSDYRGAVSRAADKLHTKILTRPGLLRTKDALADMASRTGGKAMAQDVAGATALAGTAYAAGKLGKKLLGKKKKEQKKEAKLKEMGTRALQFAKQNPEATGAVAGAVAGATYGAASAKKGKRLKGALIGGTVGAGTGAVGARGVKMIREAKKSVQQGSIPKPEAVKTSSAKLAKLNNSTDNALLSSGVLVGGLGAHLAKKEMREAGMSDEEISKVLSRRGGGAEVVLGQH